MARKNGERLRPLGEQTGIERSGSSVCATALEMDYSVGGSEVRALDGLDLTVPSGEFLLVRGRSGSGKTTLLHILAGLEKPSAGKVRIGETELQLLSPSQSDRFRRKNIGLIFQFFNLIPSLTVEMNMALPLLLEGIRLRHLHERMAALAEQLGISHRLTHSPGELSGGEMQRVAIARALIADPKVILADEPTGNLDTRNAHDVFALLREQCDRHGVTTIVMTHDLDVTAYADRVIELRDGRVESDSGQIRPADETHEIS